MLGTLLLVAINAYASIEGKEKENANSNAEVATLTIQGQVMDKASGEALAGVSVRVEGTNLVAYTDFDGRFSISNVKQGECKLSASFISYEKTTIQLDAHKTSDVKVELKAVKE